MPSTNYYFKKKIKKKINEKEVENKMWLISYLQHQKYTEL